MRALKVKHRPDGHLHSLISYVTEPSQRQLLTIQLTATSQSAAVASNIPCTDIRCGEKHN
jgi:hypothetical protein